MRIARLQFRRSRGSDGVARCWMYRVYDPHRGFNSWRIADKLIRAGLRDWLWYCFELRCQRCGEWIPDQLDEAGRPLLADDKQHGFICLDCEESRSAAADRDEDWM